MIHVLFVTNHVNDILPLMPYATHRDLTFDVVSSIQEALGRLATQNSIEIIIADCQLADGLGSDLLAHASGRRVYLVLPSNDPLASRYAQISGIAGVLVSPVNIPALESIFNESRGEPTIVTAPAMVPSATTFGGFIGESSVMHSLYELIKKVAPTMASVFIYGASGSGKELVAQAIHLNSLRANKPFLAINCGAIAEELIASALFGHEKGSFTGAIHSHKGYFEQASGGTLFLDEITETSKDLQVSLLRVLETQQITPVGSASSVSVDVRILASTNREPEIAVQQGFLREDLYYRLNIFPIKVPMLAERLDDIALLVAYFLKEHNQQNHKNTRITPEALTYLQALAYPGNIRQLKNLLHRAYILAEDVIDVEHVKVEKAVKF